MKTKTYAVVAAAAMLALPASTASAVNPRPVDPATVSPDLSPDFDPWSCFTAGGGITCQGAVDATYDFDIGLDCDGHEVHVVGREQAAGRLRQWVADSRPVFVLTSDPDTMAALVVAGQGAIRKVNLGGIHSGPGRRERLRYVYLTDAEMSTLRRLEAQGTLITAQDVPGATAVPLRELE